MLRFSSISIIACIAACGGPGDKADTGKPSVNGGGDVALHINEFVASAEEGLPDLNGEPSDWVELHNSGADEADLTGYWLTDDLGEILKWQIPAGTVLAGGGFLVIFANNDEAEGDLQASFELNRLGEDIGLYGPSSQDNLLVDAVEGFTPQATDQSLARMPDGASAWQLDPTPTPGEANGEAP